MKKGTVGPVKVKRSIVYTAEQYSYFSPPFGVIEERKVQRESLDGAPVVWVVRAYVPRTQDEQNPMLPVTKEEIYPGYWVLNGNGEILVMSDLEFQRNFEPAE